MIQVTKYFGDAFGLSMDERVEEGSAAQEITVL